MIDFGPFAALGVLLVRPGVLLIVAPCFGGTVVPAQVKVGLTVLLALALLPSVSAPSVTDVTILTLVVVREAAIGLALGLAMLAFVAAIELTGQLSGFQLGLSYSAIVDPQSGVRNNLVAVLYVNITLVAFFLVNGHHAFLRALNTSYEQLPIGVGGIGQSLGGSIAALLGLVFALGVRLAAPLVFALVLCEVAMALIARAAPTLNLMVIGAPIRLLVGLVLLGMMVPVISRAAISMAGPAVQLGVETARAFR